MAVELVIKIPEEIRLALINNIQLSMDQQSICDSYIKQAVINGILLPKNHGKLGDLDALREEVSSWGMNDYEPSDFIDAIDQADTIIEADNEESKEKE